MSHSNPQPSSGTPRASTNLPVYSLIAAVVFVGLAVAALVFVPADDVRITQVVLLVGLVVSTVPSLIASAYSERTSRDVRNGVLVDQVKVGTKQALTEHGVVTRDGPYVHATTQALLDLLSQRHGTEQTADPDRPLTTEDIP